MDRARLSSSLLGIHALVKHPVDENRGRCQLNLEASNALIMKDLVMFELLTTKSRERLKSNRPRLAHLLAAHTWVSGARISRQQVPAPFKVTLSFTQPTNQCRRCLADAAFYAIPGHHISPAARAYAS
jgi:hypothetical protein